MPKHSSPSLSPEERELELLKSPTEDGCELAVRKAGEALEVAADWRAQQAPGSLVRPAPDARKVWAPLNGWTKVAVPSRYEDLEGGGEFTNTLDGWRTLPLPQGPGEIEVARDQTLPDQWPVERHYHHAWYILRANLGAHGAERIWLRFDAVSHACVVFVNGMEAGRHVGGYTPFEFDITDLAEPGVNTLAIWAQDDTAVMDPKRRQATSQLDGGRGVVHPHVAGIRGGVYLETRRAAHVARVRIRPSVREGVLNVEAWTRGTPSGARIEHTVYEWPAGTKPALEIPAQEVEISNDPETPVESRVAWKNPKLWSPQDPNLYVLRTTVWAGGRSESYDTRFGFREFWTEGKRFMLNGKPIRLFGDGSHPKELRSIVPDKAREVNRAALEFWKREFNYTSTRLHGILYPSWAPLAADEAGVLVINLSGLRQGRLGWYTNGGEAFMRNTEAQFAEWYWRDVNSPSVVIWDMENELIRGRRDPEVESWVLRLDDFIRKLDPDAVIEHSGAAWYSPDQQVIHVHMQEQYNRILRTWIESGRAPLNLGEFWMGGRGETRLPNSYEYSDREDWHLEEARIYREQMLEMRYYGASGIMPHRLTHWPLLKAGPALSLGDMDKARRGLFQWRFARLRGQGARGIAPVVGFVWPRGATVAEGVPFAREIVVCNDREDSVSLSVTCRYGVQKGSWQVDLGPAEQRRIAKSFVPDPAASEVSVEVRGEDGRLIEWDRTDVHAVPQSSSAFSMLHRRVVVVPAADAETAKALNGLGVACQVSEELPEDAENTIALVSAGVADDALGRTAAAVRRYLSAGGRLLVLPQSAAPKWLPLELPLWSAVRTSVPEFDRGGWGETNKDLIYSREVPLYADGHPAFADLDSRDFKEWDPVDGRVSDDAFIRPNAANMRAGAAYRALLGATRRENISLAECRIGKGTAVLCQAHALRLRANPAARTLFFNLLRYLDGPAWAADQPTVGLAGDLSAARVASVAGLDAASFVEAADPATAPGLVLAGDNADVETLLELASAGRTVLVLSAETCGRLPGFRVEQREGAFYSGTRRGVADHPLFWGVASASFLPLEHTPVRGALAESPPSARPLLNGHCCGHSPFGNDWTVDIGFYGLETREPAPPLAVGWKVGRGEIVATAIEPWDRHSETHRQLLANLLANAGVPIPDEAAQPTAVEVKETVPLRFDGRLDDWTNDMEDINISEYSHAAPIALTSKDAVEGRVEGDLDFSGIVYLLRDRDNLFVGGIVFSSKGGGTVTVDIDDHSIAINPEIEAVRVNGAPVANARACFGEQPAREVIDTRLLNLMQIHKQIHKAVLLSDTRGTTFETAIPWAALGRDVPPAERRGRIRLSRRGAVLQQPVPSPDGPEWLVLKMGSGPAQG